MSVVVPTYRRPDDLRRCLVALTRQTCPADEVVVVVRDDDDEAHAVLREPGLAGLPIRCTAPSQGGLVPAARRGLEEATGGLVALLDDDAAARPDWLERMLAAASQGRVAAVGGINHRVVDGVPEHHRAGAVGLCSWWGKLTGMHYAESGLTGVPVHHLQGCNMGLTRPWPLPDLNLRGDGVYFELDLCLRAGQRGPIWYDERIAVDHYLGVRHEKPGVSSLSARHDLSAETVADACWNYAYVLAKNTADPVQRWGRLAYLLLVGQRPTWGVLRVAAEVGMRRGGLEVVRTLPVALRAKLDGWRAGSATRLATHGP